MDNTVDIHKAGGIIIKDRRVLTVRSKDRKTFNTPGGRLEIGETAKRALVRELDEEVMIHIEEADLEEFGIFYAHASEQEDKTFRMDTFTVKQWTGDIQPDNEIEEIRWVNTIEANDLLIASVFHHEILPRLKAQDLID